MHDAHGKFSVRRQFPVAARAMDLAAQGSHHTSVGIASPTVINVYVIHGGQLYPFIPQRQSSIIGGREGELHPALCWQSE